MVVEKQLPRGNNTNVIRVMSNELDGIIIKEFVAVKPKMHSYLKDEEYADKKANGTKKAL